MSYSDDKNRKDPREKESTFEATKNRLDCSSNAPPEETPTCSVPTTIQSGRIDLYGADGYPYMDYFEYIDACICNRLNGYD